MSLPNVTSSCFQGLKAITIIFQNFYLVQIYLEEKTQANISITKVSDDTLTTGMKITLALIVDNNIRQARGCNRWLAQVNKEPWLT